MEFVKRSVTVTRNQSQTNMVLTQCQKESVDKDVQKENVLFNLPKVGVCTFCSVDFYFYKF